MVKTIVLIKRHPSLTREQFSRHWSDVHAPLARSVPSTSRYIVKYVQNHLLEGAELEAMERDLGDGLQGLSGPDANFQYDCVMEAYFQTAADLRDFFLSREYFEYIEPDERRFVDREKCVAFMVSERVFLDENNRPGAGELLPPAT
jgi:hypothetical protein